MRVSLLKDNNLDDKLEKKEMRPYGFRAESCIDVLNEALNNTIRVVYDNEVFERTSSGAIFGEWKQARRTQYSVIVENEWVGQLTAWRSQLVQNKLLNVGVPTEELLIEPLSEALELLSSPEVLTETQLRLQKANKDFEAISHLFGKYGQNSPLRKSTTR